MPKNDDGGYETQGPDQRQQRTRRLRIDPQTHEQSYQRRAGYRNIEDLDAPLQRRIVLHPVANFGSHLPQRQQQYDEDDDLQAEALCLPGGICDDAAGQIADRGETVGAKVGLRGGVEIRVPDGLAVPVQQAIHRQGVRPFQVVYFVRDACVLIRDAVDQCQDPTASVRQRASSDICALEYLADALEDDGGNATVRGCHPLRTLPGGLDVLQDRVRAIQLLNPGFEFLLPRLQGFAHLPPAARETAQRIERGLGRDDFLAFLQAHVDLVLERRQGVGDRLHGRLRFYVLLRRIEP